MFNDPCLTCDCTESGCRIDEMAERRKDGDTDPSGSMADYAQSRWERNR